MGPLPEEGSLADGLSPDATGPSKGDDDVADTDSHMPDIPETLPDDLLCGECADQGQQVFSRRPRSLPEVKIPSAQEYAEHCLTHLPLQKVVSVLCRGPYAQCGPSQATCLLSQGASFRHGLLLPQESR